MGVKWGPTGSLDVASDPSDLPMQGDGAKGAYSGAMTRCTNLSVDRVGRADTRYGSEKVSSVALETPVHHITEMSGHRFEFGGTRIYRDEVSVASELTSAMWSSAIFRPYNSDDPSVYAANGTDAKQIEADGTVTEWGIDAPGFAPGTANPGTGIWGATQAWEFDIDTYAALSSASIIDDYTKSCFHFDGNTNDSAYIEQHGISVTPAFTGTRKFGVFAAESSPNLYTTGGYDLSGGVWSTDKWLGRLHSDTSSYNVYGIGSVTPGDLEMFRVSYVGTTGYIKGELINNSGVVLGTITGGAWGATQAQYYHVEVTQNGNTWYMFLDGVLCGTITSSYRFGANMRCRLYHNATYSLRIDELRVSIGIAQHTTTFTPMTSAYAVSPANYPIPANSFLLWAAAEGYTYTADWEYQAIYNEAGEDDNSPGVVRWWEAVTNYVPATNVAVVYTYCRFVGSVLESESNPSPVGYADISSRLYVAWAQPSDSQVTHVRVYRALVSGGSEYYLSGTYPVADGFTAETVLDASLGAEVAYDHDPPPAGLLIVGGPDFAGYLFGSVGNKLYFCKPNQPDYWPSTYYVEVGAPHEPITAITLLGGQTFALTRSDLYLISGTSYDSFVPLRQAAITGTLGNAGVLSLLQEGILHSSTDGLWGYSSGKDECITNTGFRTIFRGEAGGSIPAAKTTGMSTAWIITHRGKIYYGWPSSTATYPDEVLVYDRTGGRPVHYDYGREFSAVCVDRENDRLLATDSSGYVWALESRTVTDDGGTAIAFDVQTMEFSDHVRRYFPRWAKYDVAVGVGCTATGVVMLDDVAKQSHILTTSRDVRKRLVTGCNGKRMSMRIYGSGPVTIYGLEVE